MKSPKRKYVAAIACAVMALSLSTNAQNEPATHHHYKVIDMGLNSYINGFEYYGPVQNLNAQGTLIGWADTNTPDPYPISKLLL